MRPEVFWIDSPPNARLAIMPRPRAGEWLEDEIAGWRLEGIDVVVSLLQREEIEELGLEREEDLCRSRGMEFLSFPFRDRGVPESTESATTLVEAINARLSDRKGVAVHCRAGIGRSSLVAACALVLGGLDPDAAFDRIGKARGVEVPDTQAQRDWVDLFQMRP